MNKKVPLKTKSSPKAMSNQLKTGLTPPNMPKNPEPSPPQPLLSQQLPPSEKSSNTAPAPAQVKAPLSPEVLKAAGKAKAARQGMTQEEAYQETEALAKKKLQEAEDQKKTKARMVAAEIKETEIDRLLADVNATIPPSDLPPWWSRMTKNIRIHALGTVMLNSGARSLIRWKPDDLRIILDLNADLHLREAPSLVARTNALLGFLRMNLGPAAQGQKARVAAYLLAIRTWEVFAKKLVLATATAGAGQEQ